MADNDRTDLVIEHLKKIQAKLSDHDARFSSIDAQVLGMKTHLAALVQGDLARNTDYAALQFRIERIERRLELND